MKIKRGFTLVEICIVLAVLMVLAALLFPVVGRMRENGRRATCQSNLSQLYLGMAQYVEDNDSRFPNFPMLSGMMLYIKNPQVFICPSVNLASGYIRAQGEVDYDPIGNWLHTVSFVPSVNGLPTPKLVGVNEAGLVEPTRMILIADDYLMDSIHKRVSLPRGASCGITLSDGHAVTNGSYSTRHNEGLNAAFFDGHIKWLTPTQAAEYECESGKFLHPPFRADGPHVPN